MERAIEQRRREREAEDIDLNGQQHVLTLVRSVIIDLILI
jgi:hypothetical protein